MVDTYYPRKIEMYYPSQVGTQHDVISKKRTMLHSFLAVKYHVGWLEEKCLSQEAVSLEIASSVVWSEAQGSYWKGRKRLMGNQPS